MNKFSLEAKVGFFFLATLAVFAYVWFHVLDFTPKDGFLLRAKFRTVEGLAKDAQVQIAGIKVGTVSGISYDPETASATVSLSINDAYRNSIPEGSRLFLRTKGLAGDKFLVIEPGKPNARKLLPGEEISQVFEPTDPDKVLESVGLIAQNLQVVTRDMRQKLVDQKGSEKIEKVLGNADTVFHELKELLTANSDKINRTIDNSDKAMGQFSELVTKNKDKISKTIDEAEKFSRTFEKTGQKFGNVASDLDAVTKDIRSGKGTLGKLTADESLYREAQDLVKEVRGITKNIQSGSGTMGRLINDPEIYYEARRAIRNMNKTAEDISEATPVSTLAIILGSVFR